jgi:hypothetical protein
MASENSTRMTLNESVRKSLSEFRLIPRVETYPKVVAFAQTVPGKLVILALFCAELRFFFPNWVAPLLFASLVAIITLLPEYRQFVLAIAPLGLVVLQNLRAPLVLGLTLGTVACGMLLYGCARRWPHSRFGQRPILFLLTGFTLLIAAACAAAPGSLAYTLLWSEVRIMVTYVWFIGYALLDRNSKPATDLKLELASFRPLWGSTNTPFPKGAAYLRRIEAKTPEQLAVTQLKGLKLLLWTILLTLLATYWIQFFHGYLQIPTAEQALAMSVRGTPVAWHLRWESQILYFFEITLSFAVTGHRFIGFCRMAGFNALRNSYRPMSSTTIVEFFNRFYHYFKELLVDFFFYPTFLRYFKKHRRIRIIFATFVAVAFGNSFFHLVRDWHFFQERGFWGSLNSYQVQFVYNIIMSAGLSISQLRKRGPRPSGYIRGHLLPIFGVIFFYCILSVFGNEDRLYTLMDHIKYLASMFFVNL